MMDYGGYWGPGNGAAGWLLMCLTFTIILGVVAAVVYLLLRQREHSPAPTSTVADPSSRAILDERFARGEICDEEYRRRRTVLRSPT